jgi:phage-related protein
MHFALKKARNFKFNTLILEDSEKIIESYVDIKTEDFEICSTIKEIYKLTSNAIHGDSFLDLDKSQIDTLVACLDAIIQCISNTKKKKQNFKKYTN